VAIARAHLGRRSLDLSTHHKGDTMGKPIKTEKDKQTDVVVAQIVSAIKGHWGMGFERVGTDVQEDIIDATVYRFTCAGADVARQDSVPVAFMRTIARKVREEFGVEVSLTTSKEHHGP